MSDKTLNFVAIGSDGDLLTLDAAPQALNPNGTYGVIELETGEVVLDEDEGDYSAGGAQWQLTFTELNTGAMYRYYVHLVIDGVDYYLPRTTEYISSACFVQGRYTNSHKIDQKFGADNLHVWLGLDRFDEAVDYAKRLYEFIADAEAEIDDAIRGSGDPEPFASGEIPRLITQIAATQAGVLAYEAKGVKDMDANGQVQHRLAFQRAWVQGMLARVRGGSLRLATDDAVRYPKVVKTRDHTHRRDRTY